jgi:predicted small metal-binding protein
MLRFECKDAGVDCGFIATGKTEEEVIQAVFAHTGIVHKELVLSLTSGQLQALVNSVETRVKAG